MNICGDISHALLVKLMDCADANRRFAEASGVFRNGMLATTPYIGSSCHFSHPIDTSDCVDMDDCIEIDLNLPYRQVNKGRDPHRWKRTDWKHRVKKLDAAASEPTEKRAKCRASGSKPRERA